MRDIALLYGDVIDGTGSDAFPANVLLRGGRIAAVGAFGPPAEALALDCRGMAVAPGFIDAHSHSDLQVLEARPEKLRQGVTTEVVGNCGFSAFPAAADASALREFANGILHGGDDWGWTGAREYLEEAGRTETVNVFSLAGHGSLRIAEAGLRQGALSKSEMDAVEGRLSDCLADGAAGFSTGLAYAPGSSAPFAELERLCRVTARHGKIYATHMRTYFEGILEALEEQFRLARSTGVRLQISHLQLAGRANWPLQERVMAAIESARDEGIDVAFDCYPYVAGSTVLTLALPQWALEGGAAALVARLRDPGTRARIRQETLDTIPWGWEDILISAVGSGANRGTVGKSILEIAEERSSEPVDAALDLLVEENAAVNMVSFNQSQANLRATLAHPLSIIISDGFYVSGRPHPRLNGTFPKLLGTFVREEKLMPLAGAIRKITSAPAVRFGLAGRGEVREGYHADVCVFDAAAVGSAADYDRPETPPDGIRYVIVKGRLVHAQPGAGC